MDVATPRDEVDDTRGVDPTVVALGKQQLGAVREELGCPALVGLDVRGPVADDAVIGLAQRGQRQGVGGGAIEDEEHLAVGFEQLTDAVARTCGPGVFAVGAGVPRVGLGERLPTGWTEAGVVVAGELALRFIRHGLRPFHDGFPTRSTLACEPF